MSASSQTDQANVGQGMFDPRLIEALNKLHDVLDKAPEADLLPELVVVGTQSAGKSSLLEALVGHDSFLPRGAGIVTRCPLVLRLVRDPTAHTPFGEFEHHGAPQGRMMDFAQIEATIRSETERFARPGKDVTDREIKLKITSSNVMNMTLVDLPGLVVNRSHPSQSTDIADKIERMAQKRIRKKSSIVVLVREASEEHANSRAFRLIENEGARERTIGILTKVDLLDNPVKVIDLLNGGDEESRLGFGYFAVKMRSNDDWLSLHDAKIVETNFFVENRDVYGDVILQCGIKKIARALSKHLGYRFLEIREQFSDEINNELREKRQQLAAFGQTLDTDHVIDQFSKELHGKMDPPRWIHRPMVKQTPISSQNDTYAGGYRVLRLIQKYQDCISADQLNPINNENIWPSERIWKEINDSGGTRGVTDGAWIGMAIECIKAIKEPSLACNEAVRREMVKQATDILDSNQDLQHFHRLKVELKKGTTAFITEASQEAAEQIKRMVDYETKYVTPRRGNFNYENSAGRVEVPLPPEAQNVSGNAAGASRGLFGGTRPQTQPSSTTDEDQLMKVQTKDVNMYEVEVLRRVVQEYFSVVTGQMKDTCPMIILGELVYGFNEKLTKHLKEKLRERSEQALQFLLTEDPNIADQRAALETKIQQLEEAVEILYNLELVYNEL